MHPNVKFITKELYSDPGSYQRLVEKLSYPTMTRPKLSYVVSLVNQFLDFSSDYHRDEVIQILILKYGHTAMMHKQIKTRQATLVVDDQLLGPIIKLEAMPCHGKAVSKM